MSMSGKLARKALTIVGEASIARTFKPALIKMRVKGTPDFNNATPRIRPQRYELISYSLIAI